MATSKEEAARNRTTNLRRSNRKIKDAQIRQTAFQGDNPERYQGVETLKGHVNHEMTYNQMGFGSNDEKESQAGVTRIEGDRSARYGKQEELSGMENPGRVKDPPRWEDLKPHQQERIERRAAEFGVTHESAVHALGAQVDQSFMRTREHHNFYSARGVDEGGTMRPAERLRVSSIENDVPFHLQAAANAITSPKQTFSRNAKTGPNAGQTVYPNDRVATAAIEHAKAGTQEEARVPAGLGGFHSKVKQAARVAGAVLWGQPLKEAWNPGPKVGPYHNAWADPNGPEQFFVSDTHSGGGGIAPHLSKNEQEDYLRIGGIHSFNDHVARTVAEKRGIQSISGMQSSQWSEERNQRGLQSDSAAFGSPQEHVHGQQALIGPHPEDDPVVHHDPGPKTTHEEPTDPEADLRKWAAIGHNVQKSRNKKEVAARNLQPEQFGRQD